MPRPRTISEPDALERALLLFWERGYDRTSIADLCAVIGVGPSSVYNAFGSKEALYSKALAHYMQSYGGFAADLLAGEPELPAGEFVRRLLREAVKLYTTVGQPAGCAVLQSGGAGSPDDAEACAITLELKHEIEAGVRKRLEARARKGDALAATPRTLARFILASMRGLSQLAIDGASRRELLLVADHAAQSCVTDS